MGVSPKIRILFSNLRQIVGTWGSTGLYGEQATESWHGFINKHAPRLAAETALLSCRKVVQMMALSGVASDVLRRSKAPIRKCRARPSHPLRPEDRGPVLGCQSSDRDVLKEIVGFCLRWTAARTRIGSIDRLGYMDV